MNILLIPEKVPFLDLPVHEERCTHITHVLNAGIGDVIDVGVHNGPKGKATLLELDHTRLRLSLSWMEDHSTDLYPLTLLVGLSRPQTCRKILEQASTLGACEIHFFVSEKSEPYYRESKLWKTGEWRDKIQKGVEQAFATFIPECQIWPDIAKCLDTQSTNSFRIALDNYESSDTFFPSAQRGECKHYTLAVGPERGWSEKERQILRKSQFSLLSLGPRVLRQETAVVVAMGQILSQLWEC